jgi:hypothetical protein
MSASRAKMKAENVGEKHRNQPASGENILQWRRKIGENGEGEETEASISAAKTA